MKAQDYCLDYADKRQAKGLYLKGFRFFIIILLVLGVFFRFANLEQKPYWGDEGDSLNWISGYRLSEFTQIAIQGNAMSVEDVLNYQRPDPGKSFMDTIHAVTVVPEHPPLYYLMARFWMQLFNNIWTARTLASFISLLILPSIYWLCVELFNSTLVGWMAIAIVAISPIHVLYAQEARQYSLWTVTILLSSWTLLRARRVNTKLSWGVYAVTLAMGLYTHFSSVMIAIVQGIYIITLEGFRFFSKRSVAYLLASSLGFVIFLPWIIVIFGVARNRSIVSPGMSNYSIPFSSLIQSWILNISRVFFDLNNTFRDTNLFLYSIILSLIGYALYFVYCHTEKRVWLLIFNLSLIPFLALVILDLVLGGGRSTTLRYFIPCILGIQIAIAYLITTKLTSISIKNWERKLWQIIAVTLISSGVLSCAVISQSNTWWTKQREYYHSEVAKVINQAQHPLVIAPWFDMRTLCHSLAPHVVLQDIRLREDVSSVGNKFSDVYVYKSQGTLNYFLKNNPDYQIQKTYNWKRQITPVNTTQTREHPNFAKIKGRLLFASGNRE